MRFLLQEAKLPRANDRRAQSGEAFEFQWIDLSNSKRARWLWSGCLGRARPSQSTARCGGQTSRSSRCSHKGSLNRWVPAIVPARPREVLPGIDQPGSTRSHSNFAPARHADTLPNSEGARRRSAASDRADRSLPCETLADHPQRGNTRDRTPDSAPQLSSAVRWPPRADGRQPLPYPIREEIPLSAQNQASVNRPSTREVIGLLFLTRVDLLD